VNAFLAGNNRMMDPYDDFDGVQPENDLPEDMDLNEHTLRYKAILLLLAILIPSLFIAFELLTGQISGWWVHSIQPHLHQLDQIVNF
jgi:hypothetical protein